MLCITTNRDAQPLQGTIRLHEKELHFKAAILPRKDAPHVGADSPRFMAPGYPASVLSYELFDDEGNDQTNHFYYYRFSIQRLIIDEWKISRVADALIGAGVVA
jgi:hypothetical protein